MKFFTDARNSETKYQNYFHNIRKLYLIIIKILEFLLFHPFGEGRKTASKGPRAGKAVRLQQRNGMTTPCFPGRKMIGAADVFHAGCRKGASLQDCRTQREKRENRHSEQTVKCLHLCQAHDGSGGIH